MRQSRPYSCLLKQGPDQLILLDNFKLLIILVVFLQLPFMPLGVLIIVWFNLQPKVSSLYPSFSSPSPAPARRVGVPFETQDLPLYFILEFELLFCFLAYSFNCLPQQLHLARKLIEAGQELILKFQIQIITYHLCTGFLSVWLGWWYFETFPWVGRGSDGGHRHGNIFHCHSNCMYTAWRSSGFDLCNKFHLKPAHYD